MEYGPQDVWTHVYYAAVLSTARRGDDILPHVEKMRELDPLNPIVSAHVALFLFHANRGEEPEGVKSLFSRLSMGTIVVTRQEIDPHRDGSD